MTIVNLIVKDDDVFSTPLVGVTVGVYDINSVFITQGTTNSSGQVSFSLTDPQYRVYLYKQGFSIVQPWLLNVDLSKISVTFSLTGHLRKLPETLNPRLIRVSGYLVDFSGRPRKNLTLKLHKEAQVNVDELIVENTPVTYTSDDKGYFEFDLYRTLKFCSIYLTERDLYNIEIPDRAAINLPDLLFPVPVLLTITSPINLTLSGGSITVPYTATFSDYSTDRCFKSDWGQIKIVTTPSDILSICIGKNELTITPLQTGTTTVTFVRELLQDFTWIGAPSFISPTLAINITP